MNYKSFNFSNYLKKDFSQNLVVRQKEVDNVLNELYQKKLIERLERVSKKHKKKIKNNKMIDEIHNFDFKKMLKLYNIRTLLGIINMDHPPYLYKKFKKIVKEAKDFSETNNSELVFVYLPRYYKTMAHVNIYNKEKIINLVEDLNIRVIDIDKLVFKKHSDPLSLFPFRRKNHYSSEGYALVAKEISKFFLEQ
ncbi:hypothetical protein IDH20_04630 [Pelagibacterales bacterium SAG-MED39]|nr:hypothetical protein [Pelagibacterales bacterium SAG-MED39]